MHKGKPNHAKHISQRHQLFHGTGVSRHAIERVLWEAVLQSRAKIQVELHQACGAKTD